MTTMKKLLLLIAVLSLPFLNGCARMASTIKAASQDPANLDFYNTNPWTGTTAFHRGMPGSTNIPNSVPPMPPTK